MKAINNNTINLVQCTVAHPSMLHDSDRSAQRIISTSSF